MKNLIGVCIKRPITVMMIMASVFMGGFLCLFSIPLDRMPEILLPRVIIETVYPGMNAPDVKIAVTIPLEDAMAPVKGLEEIRSVSRDGVSIINLSFRWGIEPSHAAALVRGAVDRAYPSLPHGVKKPSVVSGNTAEEPHAVIAIRSRYGDNSFARDLAEYELKARFRRLDGTGTVTLRGGEIGEARIRLNPERMVSRGFNGDDFAELLAQEIVDIPAGNAREGDLELTVVSQGRPRSIEELRDIILPARSSPLALTDIGSVDYETAPRNSLFIFKNEEQTALEIYRRPGADPVKLSRDIKEVLAQSVKDFSRDAEFVIVWDAAGSILEGIMNLMISAVMAAIAVALILALFIRHFRSSVLAALALPVSAAVSIIILKIFGRSLNSMSLAGLAMGIGLVSDASVVILDIFSRNFSWNKNPASLALGELAASVSGSSLAGTVTTVVVFLPIVFLPGPLGVLFGDLAVSLVASVVTGWIYAQFFLPALYLFFHRSKRVSEFRSKQGPEKYYRPFLLAALRCPVPLIAGAFIFCVLGIGLLLGRPMEFFKSEETAEIEVALDFPAGTNLDAAAGKAIQFSEILSSVNEISSFYGKMGTEDEDINPRSDLDYRKERLLFRCFLKPEIKREKALGVIQNVLARNDYPDIRMSVSFPRDRTGVLLGLSSAHTLMFKGSTWAVIEQMAERSAAALRNRAGHLLSGVTIRPSGTRPELRMIPRRDAMAFLGISAAKMASAIYTVTEGVVPGTMEIEGRPLDIRITGDISGEPQSSLENLPLVFRADGEKQTGPVFLGSLGQIEVRETEAILARQDRADALYLDLVPAPGKERELSSWLNKHRDDYTRIDESVFSRYRDILFVTMILVVVLLYLTMAAQFESFILPFIIMLSIPFGLAGSGLLLFFSGSGLDSGSVLGLVVLFGLAVNNSIILYEAGMENLQKGGSIIQAFYRGSLDRFRPVLISTLTTVVGLIPLLFSPGASQRAMAAAMLGGLMISTLIAVFVMPIIFIHIEGLLAQKKSVVSVKGDENE